MCLARDEARVAVGALTHSPAALDLCMLVEAAGAVRV
jgi:hypothetical protein